MAALGAISHALQDVVSPAGRLAAARNVMDHVYGPFTAPQVEWRPRPYLENKGRYLWTDAFGAVNYLTLACETGEAYYLDQAASLIDAVHDMLGRDRAGKARLGSATDDEPTRGGLRIGKAHGEGHRDGDGQYFHYLTKWAFALNRMGLASGEHKYNRWAMQLIKAVHPHFVVGSGTDEPHMWWKISIDMSHPVVHSEGNLDPFDGLVTYRLVQEAAEQPGVLQREIADMERMVANKYRRYRSDDPLDLGEALWLSHWALPEGEPWAQLVSQRSAAGLDDLWRRGYFRQPEPYRLAFREFGATIGGQVNPLAGGQWADRVDTLHQFWAQHLLTRDADITPVMFAASLVPGAWARDYTPRLRQLAQRMRDREE